MNTNQEAKLLPGPYHYLEVFISHASENKSEAMRYSSLLNPHFKVWHFEPHMLPGQRIGEQSIEKHVEAAIRDSDYFFLLICDNSISPDRPYCSKELGLALALQKQRAMESGNSERSPRPIIVPIYSANAAWRKKGDAHRPTKFPVRDFFTGKRLPDYSFVGHDPFANATIRTDAELAELMKPRMLRARTDIRSEREFRESGVFELYEALFPPSERDDRDDIVDWTFRLEDGSRRPINLPNRGLIERWLKSKLHFQMDSFFYVVYLYNTPIAFSYLNFHPATGFIAGNYIGTGSGWRGGGVVERFRQAMEKDIAATHPTAKGTVFQIEPVAFAQLEKFAANTRDPVTLTSSDPIHSQIRRLKRLEFYQRILRANVYMDLDTRRPMRYTDPCLDIESPMDEWPNAEEEYWLMWYSPRSVVAPTWGEAVSFSCLEVQAKSVVLMYPTDEGAAYWDYANKLARRSIRRSRGLRVGLGKIALKRLMKNLKKTISNYSEIAI